MMILTGCGGTAGASEAKKAIKAVDGYGVILESSTTSMPEEFTLERAATAQYHIVYEVPATAKEFSVSYLELFDDDTESSTFFTYFENK